MAVPSDAWRSRFPKNNIASTNALADNFDGWTAAVKKCLEEAGDRLPQNTNLETLSKFVLTVMEGGVMQSRAYRAIEPFDASVEHLRSYFQLLIAQRERANLNQPTAADRGSV